MQLVKSDFKAWLEAAGDDNIVGTRDEQECCPLACYLRDKTNRSYIVARGQYGPIWGETSRKLMPSWASEFVAIVDSNMEDSLKVTAKEALSILDDCEED